MHVNVNNKTSTVSAKQQDEGGFGGRLRSRAQRASRRTSCVREQWRRDARVWWVDPLHDERAIDARARTPLPARGAEARSYLILVGCPGVDALLLVCQDRADEALLKLLDGLARGEPLTLSFSGCRG